MMGTGERINGTVRVSFIYKSIGAQVYADGTRYEGQWKNDMRNGPGEIEYPNGEGFAGFWKNDKSIAEGKFLIQN